MHPVRIDAHVHVYPSRIQVHIPDAWQSALQDSFWVKQGLKSLEWAAPTLKRAWSAVQHQLHDAQPQLRRLPDAPRRWADELGALTGLPSALLEGSVEHLQTEITKHKLDAVIVIAHPPFSPNEFVLDLAAQNHHVIPIVNIPPSVREPQEHMRRYVQQGARGLKIHAAADGLPASSRHYHELLSAAQELALPVILHTGCLHSTLLYRDATASDVWAFETWFQQYPQILFILAHMNFHNPAAALELAERYGNLVVDTSWQPNTVIEEAVQRLGNDRVLFGSDWPLLGDNIAVGLSRVERCDNLNATDRDRILGLNAARLFRWTDRPTHPDARTSHAPDASGSINRPTEANDSVRQARSQ